MENIMNDFDRNSVSVSVSPVLVQEAPVGNYLPVRSSGVPSIKCQTHGTVLQHFDRAKRELAMAVSVDEDKDIRDKAEAMRLYLQQARESLGMQNLCAEIKLRAERRIGELLRESGISDRRRENLLRGQTTCLRAGTASLADLGITRYQSRQWQMMSTLTEEDFEDRVTEIKEAGRELTTKTIVDHARLLQRERVMRENRRTSPTKLREPDHGNGITILRGDFRRVLVPPVLEPDSVDLILTAAPNKRKDLSLYNDLGKFAATVLKPGRLLAVYASTYHLAEVMRRLSRHLDYVWTVAVVKAHGTQVISRRIKSEWTPILLFSKGDYRPEPGTEWLQDRMESCTRGEGKHDREQPVEEALLLVKALTHQGSLVVDPLLGSGTTGVACKQLNRRVVGCDVDRKAVEMAVARLDGSDSSVRQ